MKRPEILYIAPCWPHGKSCGSQQRVLHLARALKEIGNLKVAVVDCVGDELDAMHKSESEFAIECHGKLKRGTPYSITQRISRLFNARSLNPNGTEIEDSLRARLFQRLGQFDLLWLSNLRMVNSFGRWEWPRSVMDIDDVPSTYERTVFHTATNLPQRFKAGMRMLSDRRREKLLGHRFTTLAVCSDADRRELHDLESVHVIPNGFVRPNGHVPRSPASPPRFGFIGQFGYPPNFEGVQWFVEKCWPLIKSELPDARLRLAGRGTEGQLKVTGRDIDALGWIEDPAEEIATWAAMVVPVHTGAGTRVKVAEAFSRKCPLVSTNVGALGYDVEDEKELYLADTAEDFARACVKIIREPSEAAAVAERAWCRFINEWTWDVINPRVWAAAEDCLRRSKRSS